MSNNERIDSGGDIIGKNVLPYALFYGKHKGVISEERFDLLLKYAVQREDSLCRFYDALITDGREVHFFVKNGGGKCMLLCRNKIMSEMVNVGTRMIFGRAVKASMHHINWQYDRDFEDDKEQYCDECQSKYFTDIDIEAMDGCYRCGREYFYGLTPVKMMSAEEKVAEVKTLLFHRELFANYPIFFIQQRIEKLIDCSISEKEMALGTPVISMLKFNEAVTK